jgi:hypothetical protein
MTLRVTCNRVLWLALALLIFVLIGRWKCLCFDGAALYSYFEVVTRYVSLLLQPLSSLLDLLPALLFVGCLSAIYVGIGLGLGWVAAAVLTTFARLVSIFVFQTTNEDVRERRDDSELHRFPKSVRIALTCVIFGLVAVSSGGLQLACLVLTYARFSFYLLGFSHLSTLIIYACQTILCVANAIAGAYILRKIESAHRITRVNWALILTVQLMSIVIDAGTILPSGFLSL